MNIELTLTICALWTATNALAGVEPIQDYNAPYAPKYSPKPPVKPESVEGCRWITSDWQKDEDGNPLKLYRTGPGDMYCAPNVPDGGDIDIPTKPPVDCTMNLWLETQYAVVEQKTEKKCG